MLTNIQRYTIVGPAIKWIQTMKLKQYPVPSRGASSHIVKPDLSRRPKIGNESVKSNNTSCSRLGKPETVREICNHFTSPEWLLIQVTRPNTNDNVAEGYLLTHHRNFQTLIKSSYKFSGHLYIRYSDFYSPWPVNQNEYRL